MASSSGPMHIDGNIRTKLPDDIKAFDNIYYRFKKHYVNRLIYLILFIFLIFLFLPWTQNIRAKGFVTTLYQDQRPQQVVSQIPGKILKWYVKEGDLVKAGDTILLLGEVKDDYLDPNIINRTQEQISQNQNKVEFYSGKVQTSEQQIGNLESQRDLKMQSLRNKREQIERKIEAKQAELNAAKVDLQQSREQIDRARIMLEQEAISKFDFERRNATFQKAQAAFTDKQNELDNLKQDLILNRLDIDNTTQEYSEKIAKAQGDIFTSNSEMAAAREKVADLSIKRQNLSSRSQYYYLTAPQDGQVIQAKKAGINEIVKEGEMVVEIVPQEVNLAVEIFVEPFDLPLLNKGQKARFMFDGFPAIVFSGWPATSIGTFGGKIVAIESNRNKDGKFRVLLVEDPEDRKWPPGLKLGTGALSFALLKDVPVWYELWRNINGFPPEFYKVESEGSGKEKSLF
ncbi:MAG: HlyD family secretion protein [Chitinophagaceae bacterium]|nr:HlyD family secretion protein [Chitinophagaceae bacterium]